MASDPHEVDVLPRGIGVIGIAGRIAPKNVLGRVPIPQARVIVDQIRIRDRGRVAGIDGPLE